MARTRDVFGILPTGFGKSLTFQLLPRLLKDLWRLERACVLIVTPLVSIMKDQVYELTRLGLRAFASGLGDEKWEKTFDRVSIFIAFRCIEGVSAVGDRTVVGHLELLVRVVH